MVKRKRAVARNTAPRQRSRGEKGALPSAHPLQSAAEKLTSVNQELQSRNLELSHVNDELSHLLTSLDSAVVMLGRDLRIRRLTRTAEKVLHLSQEDIGRPAAVLSATIGIADLEKRALEVMETRRIQKYEVRDRDGRWYLAWLRPYRTAKNRIDGAVITLTDVDDVKLRLEKALAELRSGMTERTHLLEQFRQAQKMETLGRLAGGLAHDFNNLLTAIGGLSEILLEETDAADPRCGQIQEINETANRAVGLTRKILTFSRKQMLQVEVLDLNELVTDLTKVVRSLIGDDLDLRLSLAPNPQFVRADAAQLEQVILNLAVNARDASPRGGSLTIQIVAAGREDSQVALIVRDTGTGMDAQTQSHLFEPFFTTKARGHGTGLGLSTVYGIVHQSAGEINVHSEVGKGTTFTILLPRAEGPATGPPKATERGDRPVGSETIMIVEDEPAVRGLARRVLAKAGYSVLEASGAQEAIGISQRHPGTIHLVLTDLSMPDIDGNELIGRIAAMRPDASALLMSGYSHEDLRRRRGSLKTMNFLQKPFSGAHLLRKVRDVLDSPSPKGGSP